MPTPPFFLYNMKDEFDISESYRSSFDSWVGRFCLFTLFFWCAYFASLEQVLAVAACDDNVCCASIEGDDNTAVCWQHSAVPPPPDLGSLSCGDDFGTVNNWQACVQPQLSLTLCSSDEAECVNSDLECFNIEGYGFSDFSCSCQTTQSNCHYPPGESNPSSFLRDNCGDGLAFGDCLDGENRCNYCNWFLRQTPVTSSTLVCNNVSFSSLSLDDPSFLSPSVHVRPEGVCAPRQPSRLFHNRTCGYSAVSDQIQDITPSCLDAGSTVTGSENFIRISQNISPNASASPSPASGASGGGFPAEKRSIAQTPIPGSYVFTPDAGIFAQQPDNIPLPSVDLPEQAPAPADDSDTPPGEPQPDNQIDTSDDGDADGDGLVALTPGVLNLPTPSSSTITTADVYRQLTAEPLRPSTLDTLSLPDAPSLPDFSNAFTVLTSRATCLVPVNLSFSSKPISFCEWEDFLRTFGLILLPLLFLGMFFWIIEG